MSDVVRYRLRWYQLPWTTFVPLGLFQLLIRQPGDTWADKVPYALAVAGLGVAMSVVMWLSWYVELRPDGIVVSGLNRYHDAWRTVAAIYVDRNLGTSQVRVLVPDGVRQARVPARTRFLGRDRDFDEKVATITRYWEEHRGADWTPPELPPWVAVPRQAGSAPR